MLGGFGGALGYFLKGLLKAWERNLGAQRAVIGIASFALSVSIPAAITFDALAFPKVYINGALAVIFLAGFTLAVIVADEELNEEKIEKQKIEDVEERVRDNPDKPEYAWDLARRKLEGFLDRNLNQVTYIFWLTTLVMICGFGLILYGVIKAYSEPANFSVSVVSAASGVMLSFIGGSFLIVYRTTMTQAASYVNVLERINAVGMAVQIASSIPDSEEKIKEKTTSELAKALLLMYSTQGRKTLKKSA
jgi:nitrate reductase gamma subunit